MQDASPIDWRVSQAHSLHRGGQVFPEPYSILPDESFTELKLFMELKLSDQIASMHAESATVGTFPAAVYSRPDSLILVKWCGGIRCQEGSENME